MDLHLRELFCNEVETARRFILVYSNTINQQIINSAKARGNILKEAAHKC